MKVLVCGGRDYLDAGRLESELWRIHNAHFITHIIHGGAKGADSLAGEWARSRAGVQEVVCQANWYLYGKSAGPARNALMLDLAPDLVLAFPGGRGTADMVKRARVAGVSIEVVQAESEHAKD